MKRQKKKKERKPKPVDLVGHTTKHYKIVSRFKDEDEWHVKCICIHGHTFFYSNTRKHDALAAGAVVCRQCELFNNTKMCNSCYAYKIHDEYGPNKKSIDGFRHNCRSCARVLMNDWYKKCDRKKFKKRISKWSGVYLKRKLKTDPIFKFAYLARIRISQTFRLTGFRKPIKTEAIIGCSIPEFNTHLILTALNNYGYWAEPEVYEVDHIIPISWATTQEEVVRLNHHSNLQLLTPKDNMKKLNHIYDPIADTKVFI